MDTTRAEQIALDDVIVAPANRLKLAKEDFVYQVENKNVKKSNDEMYYPRFTKNIKNHDDEEQGDNNEQTDSDNDGDDFVHPKCQQQVLLCHLALSNMLNPSPDTGIDSLFNLNTKSTSLIDVAVTTFAEPPLLSATTLPPPPTPLITHLQQTPVPTPPTVQKLTQQDLSHLCLI
ncbi:hypothetical protein Tco_0445482 [Tanacetum coccineum]